MSDSDEKKPEREPHEEEPDVSADYGDLGYQTEGYEGDNETREVEIQEKKSES